MFVGGGVANMLSLQQLPLHAFLFITIKIMFNGHTMCVFFC
jgi:hypothetical protein